MAELRTFTFAVAFIVIFGTFLATIPVDLQGTGASVDQVIPVNPSLVSDFSESENFTKSSFVVLIQTTYTYDLGGYEFLCEFASNSFSIGAKVKIGGILWLGALSYVEFTNDDGVNRGNTLSFAEIDADSSDGTVRYSLVFESDGNNAGGFVLYWNTTEYTDSSDAWDNDELYLLHGQGFTTNTNIASLLLSLLFLQLPNCPVLVNVVIVIPYWAAIIYLIWWIIISMIPFLGGG